MAKLSQAPPKGISVSQKEDKTNHLEARIIGPENTPYEEGVYNLEILIPENYPFSPPSIRFLTKVYHLNIDDNGRICLDLIKMPPKGNWKPTYSIENILIAIRMLLENPNPDDPLMAEIADEYLNNREIFTRKAREHCRNNAKV